MIGRIYQLSDIHFGVENKAAVEAALAHCHETPPDLVLITGDITQQGFRDEFEAAARWIKAMPEPVFVTVGNHDVPYWNAYDRLFQPWKRFETSTGHPAHDHQFETDKLMVRGVTTARGWQARLNWSKGVIDLDQTRRAAEALAATPRDHLRILACHHPLIEMIGAPMTGEVKRGRAAAEIFAGAGVDIIASGHVHVPFALPIGVGDHRCYAVGCGTLSVRERGMAPSFNCITWSEAEICVTALAWTGSRFEAQRTWNLDRRVD
ncbi:metallophosphoesterase [Brevundimonas sp.]|uniref:metallophosphoesterase family protein n=1 Tax=Brevundimonas sp. TaxID=1871086 RepID=UPI0025E179B5|nr:metallophosphoesterase [Brevundimonas sp.]